MFPLSECEQQFSFFFFFKNKNKNKILHQGCHVYWGVESTSVEMKNVNEKRVDAP